MQESRWFKVASQRHALVRLVCFHYAGGTSYVFKNWPQFFGDEVEVVKVELPGHATRIHEPLLDSMESVCEELVPALATLFADGKPVVFLGHSLGAQIAFEASRRLLQRGLRISQLIAVASWAPHRKLPSAARRSEETDESFLSFVKSLGQLDPAVLENEQLLSLILPILRADFKMAETYSYAGETGLLPFPILAYGGLTDVAITSDDLKAWGELSSQAAVVRMFEGGHFFLQDEEKSVLPVLKRDVLQNAVTLWP